MTDLLPGLGFAALIIAGVVAVLAGCFVWRYHRVTWRRTAEGRHLMRFTIVVGITYGLTALSPLLVHVPPIVAVGVQLALFGWAALEMHGRNVLLREAQRQRSED